MKTILIVDDELSTRSLISRILSNTKDLAVLTACNGQEALEILEKTPVDLVVTDIVMPVMDGFELMAYLSENHPEIPIFAMTAFESPEVNQKIKALKIAQYFSKPLLMDEFKTRLFEELDAGAEGQIRGISLVSFLQLVEMETKTCTLTIRSKSDDKSGKLYFIKGDLTTAETGDLKNEDAVIEIVGWENTSISIAKHCKKVKKEMTQPLLNILMEGMRLKDEKEAREKEGKRPLQKRKIKKGSSASRPKAAPAPKTPSPKPVPPDPKPLTEEERLANLFQNYAEVIKFQIFDKDDTVIKSAKTVGEDGEIKPSSLLDLSSQTEQYLEYDFPVSLIINTKKGNRHILFKYKENNVVVTLKSGFSPITFLSKLNLMKR